MTNATERLSSAPPCWYIAAGWRQICSSAASDVSTPISKSDFRVSDSRHDHHALGIAVGGGARLVWAAGSGSASES